MVYPPALIYTDPFRSLYGPLHIARKKSIIWLASEYRSLHVTINARLYDVEIGESGVSLPELRHKICESWLRVLYVHCMDKRRVGEQAKTCTNVA